MFHDLIRFGRRAPRRVGLRGGFTLIELLVVIAIIAILASILFPVFARARENARRSSCQSNLKQISLGIMQYSQDYDELLPSQGLYAGDWTDGHLFTNILPYTKSKQLYSCPTAGTTNYDPDGSHAVPDSKVLNNQNANGTRIDKTNYVINGMYVGEQYGNAFSTGDFYGNPVKASNLSSVEDAAGTAAVMDGGFNLNPQVCDTDFRYYPSHTPPMTWSLDPHWYGYGMGGIIARHLDTVNVAFLDGHVKAMKMDQLLQRNTSTNRYRYFTKISD